tara:strand:+ start:2877 stop:3203 length:327 start_codon:yes stop_codon:yes gene_type:complete
MAVNYTEKDVEVMVSAYTENPSRETVEILAEQLNKSVKSIIGKLSREGVYQKAIYRTKTGELPVTKAQLIEQLAELFEMDSSQLMGLEKAPKQHLKMLVRGVRRLKCE